jgi:hypothetical protein
MDDLQDPFGPVGRRNNDAVRRLLRGPTWVRAGVDDRHSWIAPPRFLGQSRPTWARPGVELGQEHVNSLSVLNGRERSLSRVGFYHHIPTPMQRGGEGLAHHWVTLNHQDL